MGRVTMVSGEAVDNLSTSSTCPLDANQQDEDMKTCVIDDGTSSIDIVSKTSHPDIQIGELIDCIGSIHFISDQETSETKHRSYYLEATSVAIVNNPQEETLRQLELSKSKLDYSHTNSFTTLQKLPKNRILTTPHLQQKLNILHNTMHPYPSITLNSDDALRYINYSSNHGGLSINELESLAGATLNKEKRAVRLTVEELQGSGMVFVKEGKLFPL